MRSEYGSLIDIKRPGPANGDGMSWYVVNTFVWVFDFRHEKSDDVASREWMHLESIME